MKSLWSILLLWCCSVAVIAQTNRTDSTKVYEYCSLEVDINLRLFANPYYEVIVDNGELRGYLVNQYDQRQKFPTPMAILNYFGEREWQLDRFISLPDKKYPEGLWIMKRKKLQARRHEVLKLKYSSL